MKRACEHLGSNAYLCKDVASLTKAQRIIFPGVGAADSAMVSLKKTGLDKALIEAYRQGTPILGICLGMQISLSSSEEGATVTLNMIPGSVCRFSFNKPDLKIPHMGWNTVKVIKDHPFLKGSFNTICGESKTVSSAVDGTGLRSEKRSKSMVFATPYSLHQCQLLQPPKSLETTNALNPIHQTSTLDECCPVSLLS